MKNLILTGPRSPEYTQQERLVWASFLYKDFRNETVENLFFKTNDRCQFASRVRDIYPISVMVVRKK
jgi:hypothetical protein